MSETYTPEGMPPIQPQAQPPRPTNWLVWNILAVVFCCFPFAIPGIVCAARSLQRYNTQQYDEAYDFAAKAKKWFIISVVVGVVVNVICIILYCVGLYSMIESGEMANLESAMGL